MQNRRGSPTWLAEDHRGWVGPEEAARLPIFSDWIGQREVEVTDEIR